MNRFVYIGERLVNTHFIRYVSNIEDCTLKVTMADNSSFEVPEAEWNHILGYDHIVSLCPCENLWVNAIVRGHTRMIPVAYMALTASGDIRPMTKDLIFIDSIKGLKMTGYECGGSNEDEIF